MSGLSTVPPRWAGRFAARLTIAVLDRDTDPALGYAPCRWCGAVATTADHWPVARSDGGPDTLDNLVAACKPCNSSRGARHGNYLRSTDPPPSRAW